LTESLDTHRDVMRRHPTLLLQAAMIHRRPVGSHHARRTRDLVARLPPPHLGGRLRELRSLAATPCATRYEARVPRALPYAPSDAAGAGASRAPAGAGISRADGVLTSGGSGCIKAPSLAG